MDRRRSAELSSRPSGLQRLVQSIRHDAGGRAAGALRCHIFDGTHPELTEALRSRGEGAWRLAAALVLSLAFMVAEMVAAYFSNSLALWSDSVHMMSDVTGFAISLFAQRFAQRRPSATHSFGYLRAEVLGALASVMMIWAVTGVLVWEAVGRFMHPEKVGGRTMVIVGCLGLLSNVTIALVMGNREHGPGSSPRPSSGGERKAAGDPDVEADGVPLMESRLEGSTAGRRATEAPVEAGPGEAGQGKSVNERAAFIHAIGDAVQNVGVVLAGVLIWLKPGPAKYAHLWLLADPLCTFLFSILVLMTTSGILRELSDVLMERAPRDQEALLVVDSLMAVPGVAAVHDVHLWQLAPGIPLFSCHVVMVPGANGIEVLAACEAALHKQGLRHTTVQVEEEAKEGHVCGCSHA